MRANCTDITGRFARNLTADTSGLKCPLLNFKSNLLGNSCFSALSKACCSNNNSISRPTSHTLTGSTVVMRDDRLKRSSRPVPPTPDFSWNRKNYTQKRRKPEFYNYSTTTTRSSDLQQQNRAQIGSECRKVVIFFNFTIKSITRKNHCNRDNKILVTHEFL